MKQDTICAISTPPGSGGIAVIRLSGPEAITIADQLFVPGKNGCPVREQASHSCQYGRLMEEADKVLDYVLLSVFRGPNSFTGEDTVEFYCHGSLFIQQRLIQLLIQLGCRQAGPGEFTQRAFLNGKMDLSQAEAVADLIAADSSSANQLALKQMRGGFSKDLADLREKLLHFVSLIELELDFSEEDLIFASRDELKKLADQLESKLSALCESFSLGNAIKNGIPVAIVGETNSGKSTLLNKLLNEDKAIVSDIHGTTRDSIEDLVSIRGLSFRFIDTAGLRKTKDRIESLGIERTYQKIEQASIILWLIDSTQLSEHIDWMADRIIPRSQGKKLLLVFNKTDKIAGEELGIVENLFAHIPGDRIQISAKYGQNIEELKSKLIELTNLPEFDKTDTIVSNIRHFEALSAGLEAIRRVREGLQQNLSGDFIAQDIRECMYHLGLITGQISNDEVLGQIFSRFCIGK
ncbi:MAG: tRNA uridine-5-carboxymethylaminomethyl(34) synthesis GTPase MnmE [Bacteroidales bacterium]|jgi:tRNA modification GTPase|nr:tRNA uridine-5-carboxymethylaminomethyl(34) synthesis GTPase MnmE [Bacteroidales bacterium]OQC03809.1 MAG: tRNA modification GTPase MnmE [Bacteroidetes bacterium ADurb.Bin090]NLV38988.1 tRNA uridine-5-carboxymethylaminomethyl(34) synthesis GTPase MnmE [Bacteroidales bacterium]HNZ80375.1 tRNA uridine-5-carboxymethylaminomethyl(34) synthesis GTPase MnmE [Bacteroidales bacterium]HOH24045.1 tRNA uridine-5-carboxymethylaminomethyl(34) synthesis GTPase MnmE [Bacteroidales bacterium]